MYHYVRTYEPQHSGLRFLHINDFRAQLDYFGQHYGFVGRGEWDRALASGSSASLQGKVLLTFDDGLACSYKYVYPEIKKRGLWGMFFVPSGPYQTGSLLNVHKIHLICASIPAAKLDTLIQDVVREEYIPFQKRDAFRQETYRSQRDQEQILRFKRTFNYYVDEAWRADLLEKIGQTAGICFPDQEYYIPPDKLQEMDREGMIIGGHSMNHLVMSKLDVSQQRTELEQSLEFLNSLGISSPPSYCHPYGGPHTYTQETLDLLDELGFAYAFDVRSQEVTVNDWRSHRFALPRFDCNEFPFGSAFALPVSTQAS